MRIAIRIMFAHHRYLSLSLLAVVCLLASRTAFAQNTAFTYQGKLSESSSPASGQYDFQFKLYDTETVGTGVQKGSMVPVSDVTITNGIFTVQIDFGACASCFDGSVRFLEIAVKQHLGSTFTTLGPRQPITSNPYAIRSLNSAAADGLSVACVNCVTSSQIQSVNGSAVTGTIPVASVPALSPNYIQNGASLQGTSNFNISGTGSAGIFNAATQYNIGGTRILSVAGINNAFVGVDAGFSNTTGGNNSFFGRGAGPNNTMGVFNSFFGSVAGNTNTTGGANSFFGYLAGYQNVDGNNNTAIGYAASFGSSNLTNATAIGYRARVDQSDSLVLGSINGVNAAPADTKVGIGITAPSATLHVVAFSNSGGENTATFQAPTIGSNQSHIHYGTNGDWYIRSAAGAGKVILQDTGGNVGIGTASPVAKLDVRDGTGASGSGGHLQIGAPIANGDEKIIVFGNSGDFGPLLYIGEQGLDNQMVFGAADDFRFIRTGFFSSGNVLPDSETQTLGSSSKRWGAVYAVNGTIQTSDARLKQRIANLKYGLTQVMQLRPVSFQWKAGNDKRTHLGLIAQEVDAVLPEAVQKGADPSAPLGMNYSDLIPVLIKAIQEQQGTLERAQAEIKTLRAENEALSRRIIAVEATSIEATSTKKAQ